MTQYPITPVPNLQTKEKIHRPINRTQFEANYTQIRPTMTRSKMQFTLTYNDLDLIDYQILKAFFIANTGADLNFVHPVWNDTHTVYIDMDDMEGTFTSPTTITTSVILTEV